MTPLPVFFSLSLFSSFCEALGRQEKQRKKPEHCISHQTQEPVWRGPKALGSQELEQGAEGTGRGRGGGSWQTGLWDGDCRKEMLNPCVCSGQHRSTINVCLVKAKTHKTARFFLPKENGVMKMRQWENRGTKV